MRKPPPSLAEVEAKHGFVFGTPEDHDTEHAAPSATLACSNSKCGRRGMHVQIHEDTILPVHCGGCHAVLLADDSTPEDVSKVILDTVSPEILDQLLEQLEARRKARP